MADQTALNGGPRGRVANPLVDGVLSNLAGFGTDLATLAELQAKLALLDVKEASQRASIPVSIAAGAFALGLGSLPVALLGVAELLIMVFKMQRAWALLLTAAVVLGAAALAASIAVPRLRASFETLRRSREELTRNLAWVKTILAQSGRYTPNRR